MERYLQIINIALDAVLANKFRSILTALGIIFGVAAVIAMMAIGNGARQEILDQMKMVGVNNIVITPVLLDENGSGEDEGGKTMSKKYSPGLSLKDAESIRKVLPTVLNVSPQVTYETYLIHNGKRSFASLSGVTNDFFRVFSMQVEKGELFSETHLKKGSPVCVIGASLAAKFFPYQDPIGQQIKCGHIWLRIIGILEDRFFSLDSDSDLGIANSNRNIYAPLQTVLLRFKDRSLVTERSLLGGDQEVVFFGGGMASFRSSGGSDDEKNKNQLDKIIVQVDGSEKLNASRRVVEKLLNRRHQEVVDYEIKVPELLLKQEQRTKDIFNIVLGAIASISLIVGGIGIMNIMLASVMERIREIGVRMATGARKSDIVFQFLAEATLISITGGIIGILLGFVFSRLIMETTGILTIVSPISIIISFGVSAFVGILFGYVPAKRASEQDPVESLRHD